MHYYRSRVSCKSLMPLNFRKKYNHVQIKCLVRVGVRIQTHTNSLSSLTFEWVTSIFYLHFSNSFAWKKRIFPYFLNGRDDKAESFHEPVRGLYGMILGVDDWKNFNNWETYLVYNWHANQIFLPIVNIIL